MQHHIILCTVLLCTLLHFTSCYTPCMMAGCAPELTSTQDIKSNSTGTGGTLKWIVSTNGTQAPSSFQDSFGCSSSGTTSVCSLNGGADGLVAIDAQGSVVWRSTVVAGSRGAGKSVPIIALGNGGGYVKDDTRVGAVNNQGKLLWEIKNDPTKYDMNLAENGLIISVMEKGGLLSIDPSVSNFASIFLDHTINNVTGTFLISSTPAMTGNTAFVTGIFTPQNTSTALNYNYSTVAAAVATYNIENRIELKWLYVVDGVVSSSPMVLVSTSSGPELILFSSLNTSFPTSSVFQVFALMNASTPQLLWTKSYNDFPNADRLFLAQDPSTGFWMFAQGSDLIFLHVSEKDGSILESVDLRTLTSDAVCSENNCVITSHVTIVSLNENAFLFVGIYNTQTKSAYVCALDISNSPAKLAWSFKLSDNTANYPIGQFPVNVDEDNNAYVVFNTNESVVYAIDL